MTLSSPDANNIGRYRESDSLDLTLSDLLNLGLDEVSARLTTLRPRYCELTVTAAAVPNNTTSVLGTAGALAYTAVAGTSAWRDPTTNPQRITPNVPGRYLVMLEVEWVSNTTGFRVIQLARNGTSVNRVRDIVAASADSVGSAQLATEYTMNGTTDFISATVFQNSGGNLNVTARLVVRYLGPA